MSCSTTTSAWVLVDLADQFGGALHFVVGHAGGRLVEQDQIGLAAPAPWRSRPIGAGRARAGRRAGPRSRSSCSRASVSSTISRACASDLRARGAEKTFSRTDRPLNTFGTWVLMPTPSRAISCGLGAGDVLAAEQDRARGRRQLAGQHLEEGALAGAVRADQAAQLDLAQGEVDVADGVHAAEAHGDAVRLEQDRRSLAAPRRLRSPAGAPADVRQRQQLSRTVGTMPCGTSSTKATSTTPRPGWRRTPAACRACDHQVLDRDAAEDRADQGAEAADQDPDDDLRRHGQAEHRRADEAAPVREQAPGQPGDAAADDERQRACTAAGRSPAASARVSFSRIATTTRPKRLASSARSRT